MMAIWNDTTAANVILQGDDIENSDVLIQHGPLIYGTICAEGSRKVLRKEINSTYYPPQDPKLTTQSEQTEVNLPRFPIHSRGRKPLSRPACRW